MSVTAGVSDATIAIREKLRGKIGQTKVKRYWPGKAPEWADEAEEHADLRTTSSSSSSSFRNRAPIEQAFPSDDDPRLRRLADIRGGDRDEARADHRCIRHAEIVSTEEEDIRAAEDATEEEDLDAVEERRRRIREKAMESRRREDERELPTVEEAEEESECETDSEEEEANRRAMAKPVFVLKQERETIAERETMEAAERALEEAVNRRMAERKAETKQIVVEKIREEHEVIKSMNENEADTGDVDTDDEVNEAEEYEGWKAREIARIKCDREDREAMLKEKEEIERVRNMTEEEKREWERKNPKQGGVAAPKQKWRFMQKYYHKGAFFQDQPDDKAATMGSDDIYRRDFSAPTGEDKLNKTILPKVMQVKHFGRSGRTKWTHLVKEDTTDWTTPYVSSCSLSHWSQRHFRAHDESLLQTR
ncbi:hypothetical protein RND81_06G027800 [Saponaria officinalis]|uniref:Micro-fibrillar-associated protein 1 C-terminal domain-containing protein n=1 Tax=Saponaria officinalis TaxID=3572 RepID=A0AAW1K5P5_SAPOF